MSSHPRATSSLGVSSSSGRTRSGKLLDVCRTPAAAKEIERVLGVLVDDGGVVRDERLQALKELG